MMKKIAFFIAICMVFFFRPMLREKWQGKIYKEQTQYSYSISLTPSADIAVQDEKRIHFFNKKGEFQKTLKIDRRIWAFDFFPDGRLLNGTF